MESGLGPEALELAAKMPALELPPEYQNKSKVLPTAIDNSQLPFFRPTFTQLAFWNCGQSASVGYNFTYELNQAREASGILPENQMSVHFSWNFMNTGYGWGVSYLHSYEILKHCGNPNLADYGGLFSGDETRWMSGYEKYENAMHNRISDAYSIDVGTPEGLTVLKHWLNDHLDGSPYGGTANFYLSFWGSTTVPENSPEAGNPIIIDCFAPAGHAMTIVGYNDSVAVDINMDGQFTNNKDINGDGLIDMQDWEIGALRYRNSTLNNDGYGLMMYRTLALKYGEGGIWNQQMHVVKVREDYSPLASMRLKINHNSRDKIKLVVGISQDTISSIPEYTMDFPIFNYQGGDFYMQGGGDEESKSIELSLDITPLLGHIESGSEAKYFIQIAEQDPHSVGEGSLEYFSVLDFQNNKQETISQQFPKTIEDNTVTTASVVANIAFDKVEIITDELPAVNAGETLETQVQAKNGSMPYQWELVQPYSYAQTLGDFPSGGQLLEFEEDDVSGTRVDLPFSFPFYNDTIDSIFVYVDGFVMFENKPFPYPYFIGEEQMLHQYQMIAPFMADLILDNRYDDGVWVSSYDDYIELRWKASFDSYDPFYGVNVGLRLFVDGCIEMLYGEVEYPVQKMWTTGVSNGDKNNYTVNNFLHHLDFKDNVSFDYKMSQDMPAGVDINPSGLLSLRLDEVERIKEVMVQVTDANGVADRQRLQVSSGLLFDFEFNDGPPRPFDTVAVDIQIKNISQQPLEDLKVEFSVSDPLIQLMNLQAELGSLEPLQTRTVGDALLISCASEVPDLYSFELETNFTSSQQQWKTEQDLTVYAALCKFSELIVVDGNNGILEPGEEADIHVDLSNLGHIDLTDIQISIDGYQAYLSIENPVIHMADFSTGSSRSLVFKAMAKDNIHIGREIPLTFEIRKDDYLIKEVVRDLLFDRIPVLVLDIDPLHISGYMLSDLLDSLQINYTYTRTYPSDYVPYMSVFVCLGNMFDNVELKPDEADKLVQLLAEGGKVYMEGRVTWHEDEPTNLHPLFNIDTYGDGSYYEIDSVIGMPLQFTDSMSFGFSSGFAFNNQILSPVNGAYSILNLGSGDSACAVAYESGIYKTIGSSVEFGSLIDGDSLSTKMRYLERIIDFFNLNDYRVGLPEFADRDISELDMRVYPNPFSQQLHLVAKLPSDAPVSITIYDITGRMVHRLKGERQTDAEGFRHWVWNGTDDHGKSINTGLYIVRLQSASASVSKKVLFQ